MNLLAALLAMVLGYLLGSISFARWVAGRVAPQQDITQIVLEDLDGEGRFKSTAISSSTIRLHLGAKYGCLVSVLDILKGAVPALAFKWWMPDQPHYLLASGMAVVGHNWPLYYRFRGGRGISPILGGMLVVDWLGVIVTNVLGLASDLVIRMPLLSSGVWLGLMVPWIWLVPRGLPERLYTLAMALIYSVSMLPEWREVLRLKREGKLDALRYAREVRVTSRQDRGVVQQASVRDVISELVSRLGRKDSAP